MKKNINLKLKMAKNTKLGRMLCRLAGDQHGAVMMEYVILGVMIAAACTAAAIYFGDTIRGNFSTMSHAGAGDTLNAQQNAQTVQGNVSQQDDKAKGHFDQIAPGSKDTR